MNDDLGGMIFSGAFSVTPRLKATDAMLLALHIHEVEQRTSACPWRVAGCGTVVVAREAITVSDDYDVWTWIVNRWLAARGYELGGFVCFHGRDAGDEEIITFDARVVLMRL